MQKRQWNEWKPEKNGYYSKMKMKKKYANDMNNLFECNLLSNDIFCRNCL